VNRLAATTAFATLLLVACDGGAPTATQATAPVTSAPPQKVSTHDMAVGVTTDDVEMNVAMMKARQYLPEFRKRIRHPSPTQSMSSVKAAFEELGVTEHMWVANIVNVEGGFSGQLVNQPLYLQRIGPGDVVFVADKQVSDWYVIDAGRLIGGYTLRVLRTRMTPEERAAEDATLDYRFN
jgi:uncharacterized protein YegJ (DUF2314 family)